MTDEVVQLRAEFEKRLQQLRAEEMQLAEAHERVRAAVIAQEGAVRGLEILLSRLEAAGQTTDAD